MASRSNLSAMIDSFLRFQPKRRPNDIPVHHVGVSKGAVTRTLVLDSSHTCDHKFDQYSTATEGYVEYAHLDYSVCGG